MRWNNADQKTIFNGVKNLIDVNVLTFIISIVSLGGYLSSTPTTNITTQVCPDCQGRKYFPDDQQTTGQGICARCWGTGHVII